jgi:hypothetical protein
MISKFTAFNLREMCLTLERCAKLVALAAELVQEQQPDVDIIA